MRPDRDTLKALLASEALQPDEHRAFADMLRRLDDFGGQLTLKQREWAEARFDELELDADEGARNLWSSGQVPRGMVDKSHGEVRQLETGVVTIRGKRFSLATGQPLKGPGR